MRGWFSKKQLSEIKIGVWNRKNRKKCRARQKSKQLSLKEEFAKRMRDNPTSSEDRLLQAMRNVRYEHGWVVSSQVVIGPYIADILIPNRKVVIEVDGSSHLGRERYDERRERFLWNSGFRVIRVTNGEVWADLQSTLAKIVAFVGPKRPKRRKKP